MNHTLRVSVTLVSVGLSLTSAMAASETGVWLTEDGRARIRTERCGANKALLCGYIVWAQKTASDDGKPFVDVKNPDPSRRSRPLLGHQLLMGMSSTEDGHFLGKIYNASNGKSYDVEMWSEDPGRLNVRGCLLVALCQTQSWTRVVDPAAGQLLGATNAAGGPRDDGKEEKIAR
ncbi:DUF2147 domain-containing protein [Methylobacterium variabile]|uniref:DUF2147 domain-containing protein n=1 Tax=Methylobacterium variabile TaxID=298794 RepID=UPI0009FA7D8B|nr:DUF2147 domain-containing protein [Methylobacterium variabile]